MEGKKSYDAHDGTITRNEGESYREEKERTMEFHEGDSCRFDDSVYPDGSEVCCEGYCLVCKDGQWEDTLVQKESY